MKTIYKGHNFVVQWSIMDAVTSLPFDFNDMFVEFIVYSDNYKGRISGCKISGNKMQAEIMANTLPVGVYDIVCSYKNSMNSGHCICRRAFNITRNPEFCSNTDRVVIESYASPLKLENMDINYLGHFPSEGVLPDSDKPAWALVGKLKFARPWFFYTANVVPPGFQTGWNDLSEVLGTYDLTADKVSIFDFNLVTEYNVSRNHPNIKRDFSNDWGMAKNYYPEYDEYQPYKVYQKGDYVNMPEYTEHTFIALCETSDAPFVVTSSSNEFTLEEALDIVPDEYRFPGIKITFANSETKKAETYYWLGGDWSSTERWIIPNGDNGLPPRIANINNRLYYSYDGKNWEACSEEIAAFFRFKSTREESNGATIGNIQISRDNKNWQDLSPEFVNHLRISAYVSTKGELPTNKPVGTMYGVGPTYKEEDTARANPIYRIYVYDGTTWVDNGIFTSIAAGIVQETGKGENVVMSQKAVTKEFLELDSKIKDNANVVNGELLHSIGNIEMDFPSSSLLDYVFYKLPLLKKGETYKLTMTLSEAASSSIYWVIMANHTEEISSPPYFQEGDISKEWSVNINNDYDSFEIRIYSGKTVPEWKLLIESSSSDIQELKDNVDAVYKNNESMKESLEKVYAEIGAIPTIEFTKQAINGTTGEPYNTSNRIASSFINGEIIQVNITEGKYGVFAYTDNEYISETGWKNASAMYNVPGATRYRIVLAKTDDSAISPSDIDYFGVNIDTSANASVLITREQYLDNSKKEIVRKNIGAVSSADISSLESAINNSYSGKFNVTRGYDNKQYSDIIHIFKNQVYTVKCTVNEVVGQALYVQLFDAKTGTTIKQLMSFVDNDTTSKEITYKTDVEQLVYIGFYSSYSGIREVSLTLSSEINLQSLYAKGAEEKVISSSASALYNPFRRKMLYHHLNQETAGASTGYKHTQVPAQSLYDVAYAKALGFEMIEANVHACSDGVFITKHGSSGTFGEGLKSDDGVDYKNVAINTISSDYIRQHITYDSALEKYNSPIPTLDEFASECKKHGMLIKADYKEGALEVLRQYLTDDCIFFTGMKTRGNFKGMMEIVWNGQDFSTFKSSCEALGHPLNIVVAAGTFSSYTDDKIKEFTSFAHSNGYTTSVAYATTNDWVRAKKLGIDANISTFRSINDFELGIDCNINDLTSNDLILDGCTYNDIEKVINMPKDSTVHVKSSKIFGFGKCAVDVCYNGTITVIMGQDYSGYNLDNFKSDGRETINVANVIQDVGEQYNRWVTIKANENTVVKMLNIRASYVPV